MDSSAADDLVQTTLERALSHWHQFDQQRDIVVWMLSIAHNAHRDTQRRNVRLLIGSLPREQLLALAESIYHQQPGAK